MSTVYEALQAKREKIYAWMVRNLPILGYGHPKYQAALDAFSDVATQEEKLKESVAQVHLEPKPEYLRKPEFKEVQPSEMMDLVLNIFK